MELLDRLNDHARSTDAGPRVAYRELTPGGRSLSYDELATQVSAFANHLQSQVAFGATVILCIANQIEYPVALLGTLAAGCNVFPVSAEIAEPELRALAQEAVAGAIVGSARACRALGDLVTVQIDATAILKLSKNTIAQSVPAGDLLLCSSGTTARPKIVVRTAASVDAVSAGMCAAIGFGPADRVLSIVPLCHSYGLEHGLLAPVRAGSTVHLCPGLDLATVERELTAGGITLFPSVPSAFDMMCQVGAPHPLPTLRKAYAAGAPLPRAVFDAFEQKFGVRIGQLYGATEIGSVTFADPADPHFDPAGVGRPYDDVRVRVVDPDTRAQRPPGEDGEVLISAPSMFRGYLHDAAPAFDGDGFFSTGDLGHLDTHGNLVITGRLKLLIEVGGLKVNVVEVENLLAQHPDVADAAVVAVRVSQTVSRLKAVVTPRHADRPPIPDDVRRFLRQRLTPYKVPRVVEVRPSLPRSPSGKLLRRLLEES